MHSLRNFGLGKNFKKFFIRKEEEAREAATLGLQVLGQTLLDLIEQSVAVFKLGLVLFRLDVVPHILFPGEDFEGKLPVLVDLVELEFLVGHFFLDIF